MTGPVVDLAAVEARLTTAGIAFERLVVGPDAVVVVSSYGGRVYGPFFAAGEAENWLPDAFGDDDEFGGLVGGGDWNVGGDRVWIGPEIAYMIRDRDDYWGSYEMPPSLDPGRHDLDRAGDRVTLSRIAELEAFTAPTGHVRAELGLVVRPAPHPLRHLRGASAAGPDGTPLVNAVEYGGYVTEVRLGISSDGAHEAESWMLDQVRAGGTAFVAAVPDAQVTDYYEPVGDLLAEVPGGVAVSLTGADRFKIGFAAPHVTGRLGYVRAVGDPADDRAVLFVRGSHSDPSAEYSEEPDQSPGLRGDSLHLYDDDGGLGGFAEIEARGTPVLGPRPEPVTDRFGSWWFRGRTDDVARVAQHLLGVPAPTVAQAARGAAPRLLGPPVASSTAAWAPSPSPSPTSTREPSPRGTT
ncbi:MULTISPECIES: hypothetical protein [unclassified Frigoribacterium]|uniref:hypothetical protein n=1 Tax=unclassified Frigoribacterium TaxID=2627005 RepID=UPI0006F9339B|nr:MULTISPECIES: hypothetical protein [unclassified Frigoribacterium]KQO47693.1 hypothetical protein ASF07_09610 [Frigoribacterium sp. Leaf254]KQT39786.1 hypothetical protein ASG28_09615 [Frigoribacterium sp. Leaf415]